MENKGITSWENEKTLNYPRENPKFRTYYRLRYTKLNIDGNKVTIYLDDRMTTITTLTENIILESLPTNITVGEVCVLFYDNEND